MDGLLPSVSLLRPSYVWTVGLDSNVVEVILAILFDVVLIGIIEALSHAISSHSNLFQLYNSRKGMLKLKSWRLSMFSGRVYASPLASKIFTAVLFLSVISNIIISFSVTGRAQNVYFEETYPSMLTVKDSPTIKDIDYMNEFKVIEGDLERRPTYLSSRLVALEKIDWCQSCNYTHCTILSYAYENVTLTTQLVNGWDAYNSYQATCVSDQTFETNVVLSSFYRDIQIDGCCEINKPMVVQFDDDGSFGTAKNMTYLYCAYDLLFDPRCFRREGFPTRCATVARHKTYEDRNQLHLYLIMDASEPSDIRINIISLSTLYDVSNETWMKYIEVAAYMIALDLAFSHQWMIELMPFISFSTNASLRKRNISLEENVSDIDLRIFLPSIFFLAINSIILAAVAAIKWYVFVFRKNRRFFNTFSTTEQILELLISRKTSNSGGEDDKPDSLSKGMSMKTYGKTITQVSISDDQKRIEVSAVDAR